MGRSPFAMYETALALSVLCLGIVGVYYSRSPAYSVYHPLTFYLAFHAFIFVFRPIYAYIQDFRTIYLLYQFSPSPSDKLTVIFAANLGMIAFAIFSLRGNRLPMQFKQDQFAIAERNRLVPAALWAIAICAPIGIYSLSLNWGRATQDASTMVMDAGSGSFINTNGNGYLAEAQLMLATCCAMIGWLFRFRLVALLPLAGFILFRAGTGGRGPFVTAAVCLALLYLYEHRQRLPSLRVVAGVIAIVAMFTAVGQDRGRSIRAAISEDNTIERDYGGLKPRFLEGMDYGNLEYFEYLVYAIPQRSGSYEYFADNLMLLTEPIPRVLWPNKPVGSPVKFFSLFDYGYPIGMTRSLPGEGWVQLGWLGVIIWCGLWGLALGYIYRRFVEGQQSAFAVLAFFSFMPMLIIVFRDGTLITLLRQSVFFFTPILLWKLMATLLGIPSARERRAQAAHQAKARAVPLPDGLRDPDWQADRQALPAAVLRRRIRLQAARQSGGA